MSLIIQMVQVMGSVLREGAFQESWRWMSRQIRCGLAPDEPRLVQHYLAEGRYLAGCTATSPWMVATTSFRLLLDTASDTALPWHWRNLCLDNAWRPLRDLEIQALCACRLKRWQSFAWELATCELEPSISLTELMQGFSDE